MKSTTNKIILIVIITTAVMVLLAMIAGVKEVPPELYGFWGLVLGWAVGAKSSKRPESGTDVVSALESLKE